MPTNNNISKKKNNNTTRKNNNSNLFKKSNTIEIIILLVIIVLIFLIIENKKYKESFNSRNTLINNKKRKKEKAKHNEQVVKVVIENNSTKNEQLSYFEYQDMKANERIINPLLPPERSYGNTYGIPINIPSRGVAGSFQQIGALYKENIESENQKSGNNNDSVVLALYGKQTYPRSRKWTYYTSSDANHQVKMPLTNKGQKCDSQCGCEEIMNDDLITIPGYNGSFRAVIYDYDVPKYIPCV